MEHIRTTKVVGGRSSQLLGSIRQRQTGSLGVRGLRCGPAVWGCGGRVDGAGALAGGAWGVGKQWPPSELSSFGQDWGCFLVWGLSADRRLTRPQSDGSSIHQRCAVQSLLWYKYPARSFRGANVSASRSLTFLVLQPLRVNTSVLPTLGIVLSVGRQLDSSYADGERKAVSYCKRSMELSYN